MADLEASVVSFALLDADVLSALGSRFYVDKVPDKPGKPFAKLSQVSPDQRYTQDGYAGRVVLLQLDVYDDDKARCNSTAESVKARFDGYRGMMGDIKVGRCWCKDVRGEWPPDARNFRRILELEIGTND